MAAKKNQTEKRAVSAYLLDEIKELSIAIDAHTCLMDAGRAEELAEPLRDAFFEEFGGRVKRLSEVSSQLSGESVPVSKITGKRSAEDIPASLRIDEIGPITGAYKEGMKVAFQLHAILKTIRLACEGDTRLNHSEIKELAAAGEYIAQDIGNFLDCQREEAASWEKENG